MRNDDKSEKLYLQTSLWQTVEVTRLHGLLSHRVPSVPLELISRDKHQNVHFQKPHFSRKILQHYTAGVLFYLPSTTPDSVWRWVSEPVHLQFPQEFQHMLGARLELYMGGKKSWEQKLSLHEGEARKGRRSAERERESIYKEK